MSYFYIQTIIFVTNIISNFLSSNTDLFIQYIFFFWFALSLSLYRQPSTSTDMGPVDKKAHCTVTFYIRTWTYMDFGIMGGRCRNPGNSPLRIPRKNCNFFFFLVILVFKRLGVISHNKILEIIFCLVCF